MQIAKPFLTKVVRFTSRSIKDTLARRGSVLKNRVENLNDEVSVARNFDYEHKWGNIRF